MGEEDRNHRVSCADPRCLDTIDVRDGAYCFVHSKQDTICEFKGCHAVAVVQDDEVGGSKRAWCRIHENITGDVGTEQPTKEPSLDTVDIQSLSLAQGLPFNLGSAVVILAKADTKACLDEAKFYINREIDRLAELARINAVRNG